MKKFIFITLPTMENAYHSLKEFAAISPPMGIIAIAAVLEKEGYKVKLIDADAEGLSFDEMIECVVGEKPDYVGSTCMTATMDITNSFYQELKKRLPLVKVVVGGPHVSALPKETLLDSECIDIVVKGEGDVTIRELMTAIEAGQDLSGVDGIAFKREGEVVETKDRKLISDLGSLPMPAYHLLKFDLYRAYMWNNWVSGRRKPIGTVFTGRGCYGKCNFCATKVIFGHRIRYFPAERIKKQIDFLVNKYNIRILYFQDDTFTANRSLVNEVCDYIIEKGYNKTLEINVSTRPDAIHLPTLQKMKRAGVRWICFGVESGNQEILDRINKSVKLKQIREAFRVANQAGLYVAGNFMIGHLGETYDTATDTIKLACELKQDFAAFSIAIPLPGTELYQHAINKGMSLPSWGLFGSINSPAIPLNDTLDAKQLQELRTSAVKKFFKRPSYAIRMLKRFHTISAIKDFTKIYISLRKEIKEKRY